MRTPSWILAVLTCLFIPALAAADEFVWAKHGTITFAVPAGWSLLGKPIEEVGYAFRASPDSPAAAVAQITLLEAKPDHPFTSEAATKLFDKMVQPFVSGSVEKRIVSHSLAPQQGFGMYCQFTDASLVGKPPEKNNFKCQYNALLVLDTYIGVVATLQFDDPDKPEPAAMLALLRSMHFTRSASSPGDQAHPRVSIRANGSVFDVKFPAAHAMLKIPGNGLSESTEDIGGATKNPSYFKLSDSASGLVVSGWFEPAEQYAGLKDFWKHEAEAADRSGLPALQNVEFSKVGAWDVVAYDQELGDFANVHVRAELVKANAWIDLHLSLTGPGSRKALHKKLQAVLESILVVDNP